MARLTVVSAAIDRELATIRRMLTSYESAGGEPELVGILCAHAARGARIEILDLVGHSVRPGLLRMGAWVLDDTAQTEGSFELRVRPLLEILGVRSVRLLGCSTATSSRGWAALTRIARATRCHVFGTRRYIGFQDYAAEGFVSDEALAGGLTRQLSRQRPGHSETRARTS